MEVVDDGIRELGMELMEEMLKEMEELGIEMVKLEM